MLKSSGRIISFRGFSLLLPLVIFLLYVFFPVSVTAGYESNSATSLSADQREQKQQQLDKLRQQMSALRQKIQHRQAEKNEAAKKLKATEIRIGERAYVLRKIRRHLSEQKHELNKLKKKQQEVSLKLKNQRSILAQQIRAAYMTGRQEYLKLLLNQQNPAVLGRTLTYYDYFNKARSQYIGDALNTMTELDKLSHNIKIKNTELNLSLKQQQAEKKRLEQDYGERASAMQALDKDIAAKGQRLNKMMADEKMLQQLLQQIQVIMPSQLTEIDKRETFARRRGRLRWPVQGKVEKLFGKSRKVAHLTWKGVIIDSKEGNDVRAVSHGRIAYADWLRGYGMLIIIDHGDGYMTLYGHNQALYKEAGDWVEEGEVISSVGQSGGQLKSGLYFEVRVKGRPSNPVKWCRG